MISSPFSAPSWPGLTPVLRLGLGSQSLPALAPNRLDPIATVMRRFQTGYAVSCNRRHARHGPLFQNRYNAILCQHEPYLLGPVPGAKWNGPLPSAATRPAATARRGPPADRSPPPLQTPPASDHRRHHVWRGASQSFLPRAVGCRLKRLAAVQLAFVQPFSGAPVRIAVPLTEDFLALLERIGWLGALPAAWRGSGGER